MPFNRSLNNSGVTVICTGKTVNNMTASPLNLFPTIGSIYPEFSANVGWNSVTNASSTCKGHVTNANIVQCGSQVTNGGYQYPDVGVL